MPAWLVTDVMKKKPGSDKIKTVGLDVHESEVPFKYAWSRGSKTFTVQPVITITSLRLPADANLAGESPVMPLRPKDLKHMLKAAAAKDVVAKRGLKRSASLGPTGAEPAVTKSNAPKHLAS